MDRLLVLFLLPAIVLAGCASTPTENDDDDDLVEGTADCPADNATPGDANATANDSAMETDECAEVPPPASSNMCVEGAEDCDDTVEMNETNGTYG